MKAKGALLFSFTSLFTPKGEQNKDGGRLGPSDNMGMELRKCSLDRLGRGNCVGGQTDRFKNSIIKG